MYGCNAGGAPYIARPIDRQEASEVLENPSIIQVHDPATSFDGALFDGDLEFLVEIVDLFLATYPDLLSEIDHAVSGTDAVETMGKDGDLRSADEAAKALRTLIDQFVPELQAALGRAVAK
jgi:hypothetical protein